MSKPGPYEEVPRTDGMKQALDALGKRPGPPPEHYTPPVSTFPLTPAARAAIRMNKARDKRA